MPELMRVESSACLQPLMHCSTEALLALASFELFIALCLWNEHITPMLVICHLLMIMLLALLPQMSLWAPSLLHLAANLHTHKHLLQKSALSLLRLQTPLCAKTWRVSVRTL